MEDHNRDISLLAAVRNFSFTGKCVIYPQPHIAINLDGGLEAKGRVGNPVKFSKEDISTLCSILTGINKTTPKDCDCLVTSVESFDKSTKTVVNAMDAGKRIMYYEDFFVYLFNAFDFSDLHKTDYGNRTDHKSYFYVFLQENYPELKNKLAEAHFNLMNRTSNPFAHERHILEIYDIAFNAGQLSEQPESVLYDNMSDETKQNIGYTEPRIVISDYDCCVRFPCGRSKTFYLKHDGRGRLRYSDYGTCLLENLQVPNFMEGLQEEIIGLAKELDILVHYTQEETDKDYYYYKLPFFTISELYKYTNVSDTNEEPSNAQILYTTSDLALVKSYLFDLKVSKGLSETPQNKRVMSI